MTDQDPPSLDLREQIAHIDLMLAQHVRVRQETAFAPWQIALTVMGAGAAFFAAGAALVKLLGP